jgi:signal transduction histidine kinase/DNA-binding response OmpR family regulator
MLNRVDLNKIDEDISLLLDNLPVGIVRLDCSQKCIYANKFIMTAMGVEAFADIPETKQKCIHPEDLANEIEKCKSFLNDHIESESTFRFYNRQLKRYIWMSNKRTLIKTSEDQCSSFMYTYQDVDKNKLLEIELRKETLKAEEAYNHKSIFLANMSHEIRTPINGIVGMLKLLEDTRLTSDQEDYINMINECSYNLMTIINDILDYSKLEVGKISLDIKPMNLQECLESTNDILSSKIYEKGIDYTYNIDAPKIFQCDLNRLKQVLLNMLSNAIKFTDKGTITLGVTSLSYTEYQRLHKEHAHEPLPEKTDDSLFLRFDIIDSGCGIHESDHQKLFKSFSQVDNHATSKIYQGTGLGLAISRELVELMNGFIWLESSRVLVGSTFSFVIQTRMSDDVVIEDDDLALDGDTLRGANVLIVDDNIYNRLSLAGMVLKWGMNVHSYSNSDEALYFARIMKFDIGLIDICMPKCDGPKFASKLRELKEHNNKTFPLIALSSLGDKKSTTSDIFVAHLIKPVKEAKLKSICKEHLKVHLRRLKNENDEPQIERKESLDSYILNNDVSFLKDNVRILLAEDVYINQRVIVSFLKKLGYNNIQLVENGQECLDFIRNNTFDIVLLDIRMPVYNGDVVLQKVQEHCKAKNQAIPYMVAVTAYCLREDKDKYLSMGFKDYIPKPVSLVTLNKCMESFIESLLIE